MNRCADCLVEHSVHVFEDDEQEEKGEGEKRPVIGHGEVGAEETCPNHSDLSEYCDVWCGLRSHRESGYGDDELWEGEMTQRSEKGEGEGRGRDMQCERVNTIATKQ